MKFFETHLRPLERLLGPAGSFFQPSPSASFSDTGMASLIASATSLGAGEYFFMVLPNYHTGPGRRASLRKCGVVLIVIGFILGAVPDEMKHGSVWAGVGVIHPLVHRKKRLAGKRIKGQRARTSFLIQVLKTGMDLKMHSK
ncbi:MAG TPA: hypothetical protein VJ385_04600 [Fibrobacteria bacterium]|nr:hypothetical protein [Fibrobacteria bacterium]